MGERVRRLWAGAEADAVGWGGVAAVARATGLAISTVRKGRDEVRAGIRAEDAVRVRRKGGGRRGIEVEHPAVWSQLEKLVSPVTRGDPESALRWTCKSTQALAGEMFARYGVRVSDKTVAKLLKEHGYSLQAPSKSVEGRSFRGWHHHVTVVLCCYAFVTSERLRHFPPSRGRARPRYSLESAA